MLFFFAYNALFLINTVVMTSGKNFMTCIALSAACKRLRRL